MQEAPRRFSYGHLTWRRRSAADPLEYDIESRRRSYQKSHDGNFFGHVSFAPRSSFDAQPSQSSHHGREGDAEASTSTEQQGHSLHVGRKRASTLHQLPEHIDEGFEITESTRLARTGRVGKRRQDVDGPELNFDEIAPHVVVIPTFGAKVESVHSTTTESGDEDSFYSFEAEDPATVVASISTIDSDEEDSFYSFEEEDLSTAVVDGVDIEVEKQHMTTDATTHNYPDIEEPVDPARILTPKELRNQRILFMSVIGSLNLTCLLLAVLGPKKSTGLWVLAFICFIKSKDCLSAVSSAIGLTAISIYRLIRPPPPVSQKWILSLIPAYSETEEQIVKTIFSLRDNGVEPHLQVMCVILDGKPRDVKGHMDRVVCSIRRPYVTSKFKRGDLIIDAGFMENVPVICFEKVKNSGKKDSLILCHDLFNAPRDNIPLYTKLLREEIWTTILPELTVGTDFENFDMVFCTDADSTIHKGALASLTDAIARDPAAIAACGLVLVELEPGYEWSVWKLYQQFQYTFGQYVRRRAEGLFGKVTCLPGCITMIAVRPEMAGAIRKYAEPITGYPVIHHQVQYLGTDRRLTYSMLSQDKKLHTLFVPRAVSETVAPQSLQHYLSQRRRWGSNAYFNNYFYLFGEVSIQLSDSSPKRGQVTDLQRQNMIPLTRLCATIEVVRLSMVYYRICNTILFIYGLTKSSHAMKIIPLLIVSQTPTIWFFISVATQRELRLRAHKLFLGFCINKVFSPFISVTVFSKVAKNLGSQVWGMTGGSAATAAPAATSGDDAAAPVTPADSSAGTGNTVKAPGSRPATAVSHHGVLDQLLEVAIGESMQDLTEEEQLEEERREKLGGILQLDD